MKILAFKNKGLVKDIKKGNLSLLVNWTQDRKDKLYKIAWSYLYNHEDIEDVFQDTIIKVHENIYSLKNEDYFETWYISILINKCREKLRKRKREVLKDCIEYQGYHEDEYNLFIDLKSIDEIFKEAIVLKYISGYSQKEIGEILDIPLRTVKSRIYRGLKELRESLKEV